jgi:hypothetical protein
LIGAVLGDDESDTWLRPLVFVILFPIFLGFFYWREKRNSDRDE